MVEQFLGYRFQTFIKLYCNYFSFSLSTNVRLFFRQQFFFAFSSTIRHRVRESAKLKREKKKKSISSFPNPYPWVSFHAGRQTELPVVRNVTSGSYHTKYFLTVKLFLLFCFCFCFFHLLIKDRFDSYFTD